MSDRIRPLFIYCHRDGGVEVLDYRDAAIRDSLPSRKDWAHTATIEPTLWLESFLNSTPEEQAIELAKLTRRPPGAGKTA